MKEHIKRLSKDSLFYGFGTAFTQLFAFVLAPILTHIFSPQQYGLVSLLQTVFGFMIVLALVNLSSGVFYYYFDVEKSYDKKVVVSTSIIFHLCIAIFVSVLVFVLAPYLSSLLNTRADQHVIEQGGYTYYIRILAVGLFFSILDRQFKSLLRMLRLPVKFAWLTVAEVLLNFVTVMVLVVIYRGGIAGVFYAAVLSNSIATLIGFLLVRSEYVKAFSWQYLGLFFAYALPQFPSVFFNLGLSQSNRFFLNYYSGLEQQGLYAIGLKVATVFLLFATAFRMAWEPFSMSVMKKDNAPEIYRKFYTYYVIGFSWLAVSIGFAAKPVLVLLTPAAYHQAYPLVAILSFALLFQTANNILGVGIWVTKKTKYTSYVQFWVFLTVIALSFVFIPEWGAVGAALVFLIGSMVQSLLYFLVSERLYPIKYAYWQLNGCIVVYAILCVIGMLSIQYFASAWWGVIVACVYSLILLGFSLFILMRAEGISFKQWRFFLR